MLIKDEFKIFNSKIGLVMHSEFSASTGLNANKKMLYMRISQNILRHVTELLHLQLCICMFRNIHSEFNYFSTYNA